MKRNFYFKDLDETGDLMSIHIELFKMFAVLASFCNHYDLPLVVTSMIDKVPGRKHGTHIDGRAFDISVKNWTELDIHRVVHRFNTNFKDVAAISASDGKPRAAIAHDIGLGAHIHFQVKK